MMFSFHSLLGLTSKAHKAPHIGWLMGLGG
jgi:hypothetical protein